MDRGSQGQAKKTNKTEPTLATMSETPPQPTQYAVAGWDFGRKRNKNKNKNKTNGISVPLLPGSRQKKKMGVDFL